MSQLKNPGAAAVYLGCDRMRIDQALSTGALKGLDAAAEGSTRHAWRIHVDVLDEWARNGCPIHPAA